MEFIRFLPIWCGSNVNLGKSTRLRMGNVDIIVSSVRSHSFDEQVFILHGIDVTEYKIVCLKSAHHFRAYYMPIAKEIITVDSPGLSTADLSSFKYKKINRTIFPFENVSSEFMPLIR